MAPRPVIYLDTSAFNPNEYPRFRTVLGRLLGLARNLGLDVIVPAPVFEETRAHARGIFEKIQEAAVERHNTMREMCLKTGEEAYVDLPTINQFEEGFEDWKSLLAERYGVKDCPFPGVDLRDVFDAAARIVRPFEGSGRGFQDFIIVRSVEEHVESSGTEDAILVADDGAILESSVTGRLRLLNLEDAVAELESMLDEEQLQEIRRIERLAQSCIMNAAEAIVEAASRVTDLNIHLRVGLSTIRRISELQQAGIKEIKLPELGVSDEVIPVIADVVVQGIIFVTTESLFNQVVEQLGPGYEAPGQGPLGVGFGLLGIPPRQPRTDVMPYAVEIAVKVHLDQTGEEFTFNGTGWTRTQTVSVDFAHLFLQWQAQRGDTLSQEQDSG